MNKDEAKFYLDNIMITYNVNQAEIATKLGITRQYINTVYNGKRDLSLKTIHLLEKIFPDVDRTMRIPAVPIPYRDNKIYLDVSVIPSNVDYNNCIFMDISGNSMSPEYNDRNKVLVDTSDKNFTDGNIYMFKINNQTYVRLINITPDKTKCIALNKEFDTFYLDANIEVNVIGSIVPNIRL